MASSQVIKNESLRPRQQPLDTGVYKVEASNYDRLGFAMRGKVAVVEINSSSSDSEGRSITSTEVGEEVVSTASRLCNGKGLHSVHSQQEYMGSQPQKKSRRELINTEGRTDLCFDYLGTSAQRQSSSSRQEEREEQQMSELPFDFLEPLHLEREPPRAGVSLSPMHAPSPLAYWSTGKAVSKQFWKAGDYESDPVRQKLSAGGMDHVRVHPKFLHSNATSHKWALGAVAELLDNGMDEVVNGATFVNVDMVRNPQDREPMLLVEDDGGGMNPESLRQCMSLGYSAKSKIANTIGQYGNGFKTSTMRLGADVIVFSRRRARDGSYATESIGMLSYTFLCKTGQEDIIVPMIDYEIQPYGFRKLIRTSMDDWNRNFEAIRQWSPYSTEAELLDQLKGMKHQGTRIIIYNLWQDEEGELELDFDANPYDIQIRGANRDEKSIKMAECLPNSRYFLTYRHSLRSYASILYLRLPAQFRMILRGKEIVHHRLIDDLMFTQEVTYKPQGGPENVQKEAGQMKAVVTIGFVKDAKERLDVQGFNVYHKNRLIKPFWRIWNASGSMGRGIVGVLEANFVEPAHDKQGFERTIVLARLETRLLEMQKTYWSKNCQKVGYVNNSGKKDGKSASKADSVLGIDPSPVHSALVPFRSQIRDSMPIYFRNALPETEVQAALRPLQTQICEPVSGQLPYLRPESEVQGCYAAPSSLSGHLPNARLESHEQRFVTVSDCLQPQIPDTHQGRPQLELQPFPDILAVTRSSDIQTQEFPRDQPQARSIVQADYSPIADARSLQFESPEEKADIVHARPELELPNIVAVSECLQPQIPDIPQGKPQLEVQYFPDTLAATRSLDIQTQEFPHDPLQARSIAQADSSPIVGARSLQFGAPEEKPDIGQARPESEVELPCLVVVSDCLQPQIPDTQQGSSQLEVQPCPDTFTVTRPLDLRAQEFPHDRPLARSIVQADCSPIAFPGSLQFGTPEEKPDIVHVRPESTEPEVPSLVAVSEVLQPWIPDTHQGRSQLKDPFSDTLAATRSSGIQTQEFPHDRPQARSIVQADCTSMAAARSLQFGTPEEKPDIVQASPESEVEVSSPVMHTESLQAQMHDLEVSPIPFVVARSLRSQIQRIPARCFQTSALVMKARSIPDAHATSSKTGTRLDTSPSCQTDAVSLTTGTGLDIDAPSSRISTRTMEGMDMHTEALKTSTIPSRMQDANATHSNSTSTLETDKIPFERRPERTSIAGFDVFTTALRGTMPSTMQDINAMPSNLNLALDRNEILLEGRHEGTCETNTAFLKLVTRSQRGTTSTKMTRSPDASVVTDPLTKFSSLEKEADASPVAHENLRSTSPRISKSSDSQNDSVIMQKSLDHLGIYSAVKSLETEKLQSLVNHAGVLDDATNTIVELISQEVGAMDGTVEFSEPQPEEELMQQQFQALQQNMDELAKERDSLREQLEKRRQQRELDMKELQDKLRKAHSRARELEAANYRLRLGKL